MPFAFVKEPRVWWPVSVQVPADGGATAEQKFEVRFRILPMSRFEELNRQGATVLLKDVVENWRGVIDEFNGDPLPFDPAALAALVDLPFVARALSLAYAEAMLTGARKN